MPRRPIDVDFFRINPLNGNQQDAFEEFGCHLAAAETVPAGSVYERFRGAGGDGGVECLYTLPDGGEWGFQAKLIHFGEVKSQVEKSIESALINHPTLHRYTILLPFDPGAPVKQRRGTRSESEKLRGYLEEWTNAARTRSLPVEFEFWFKSDLLRRLLAIDPFGGRLRFWFGRDVLDRGWFARHAGERIAALEPGYRSLGDAPATRAGLAAFARTPQWEHMVAEQRRWVRRSQWYVRQARDAGAPDAAALGEDLHALDVLLAACRADPSWARLEGGSALVQALATDGVRRLGAWERARGDGDALSQTLRVSLIPISGFFSTQVVRLAGETAMLLVGDSGVGKTHALCTAVRERAAAGQPSVLLSGRGFAGEPWVRIRDALGLPGDVGRDALWEMLNTAGESEGRPCVVFIDALNETEPRSYWREALPALVRAVEPYPWVRLCVACRTSYLDAVLPEGLRLARLEHEGIAGPDAYLAFYEEYGLEAPAMPPLGPEATHPGYLHLVCAAAAESGQRTLPARRPGMVEEMEAVLAGANRRVSARLSVSVAENLVRKAVDALAGAMRPAGRQRLPFDDALDAVSAARGVGPLGRALLDELIRENLLRVEPVDAIGGETVHEVRFAFERLADHFRAREHLRGLTADGARAAFAPGGALRALVAGPGAVRDHRGLLEALAVQLPEAFRRELTELAPMEMRDALLPLVLESLLWRTAESVGVAAKAAVVAALASPDRVEDALRVLFSIGARVGHPLNADWLHGHLAALSMPERDALLLDFLRPWNPDPNPVSRLLEWAEGGRVAAAAPETARLAATLVAWVCGGCDEERREDATMALLRLLESHPSLAAGILDRFGSVGDEYAAERHLAVAYAFLLRNPDAPQVRDVADAVARQWGVYPGHYGLSAYVRGIQEIAKKLDGRLPPARLARPADPPPPGAVPSSDDLALLDVALRRSELLRELLGTLRLAGHPGEPRQLVRGIGMEMWAMGYTHERFGAPDEGLYAVAGDADLTIGGPAAVKYLRTALLRQVTVLEARGALERLRTGDPSIVPALPARVRALARETDPSIGGWAAWEWRGDSWWLPREPELWRAVEPLMWECGDAWPARALPVPADVVTAAEPGTGRAWALLYGSREWDLDGPGTGIDWGRRTVTLTIRAYLAPRGQRDAVDARLRTEGWVDALPSEPEWIGLMVGEYPARAHAGLRLEPEHGSDPSPLVPAADVRVSAGSRPRVRDRGVMLPGAAFLERRRPLTWNARGEYRTADGGVALVHPDATAPGPPALLADAEYLRAFLRRKGLDLVWVVELEDAGVPYENVFQGELRARMAWAFRLTRGTPELVATEALSPAPSK